MEAVLLEPAVVTRFEDLASWVLEAVAQPPAAVLLDVETTGLETHRDKLVLVQVGLADAAGYRSGVIMDWRQLNQVTVFERGDPLSYQPDMWNLLNQLFRLPGVPVVGHNLTFDLTVLAAHGFAIPPLVWDILVAEKVLTGCKTKRGYDLAAIAERRLGYALSKGEREYFIDLDQRPAEWDGPLPADQLAYAARDITVLAPLWQAQTAELARNPEVAEVMALVMALDMAAVPAVVSMQHAGVLIDQDRWMAVIGEQQSLADDLGDQVVMDFGPALLAARQRAYDALAPTYNAWAAERVEMAAARKAEWEAQPHAECPTWPAYRKAGERAWEVEHPAPPEPFCDTRLPNFGSVVQLQQAFGPLGI